MGGELGNTLQNIKEFYRLTPLPPPPPSTCLVIINKSPLTSFHLYSCFVFFFQVGCGAIGCELLKNFALLGIAGGANGMVVFIYILTFSGMFSHFDFSTVFVSSFQLKHVIILLADDDHRQ